MIRKEITRLLDVMFDGAAGPLVAHLADMRQVTIEDLREIERRLRQDRTQGTPGALKAGRMARTGDSLLRRPGRRRQGDDGNRRRAGRRLGCDGGPSLADHALLWCRCSSWGAWSVTRLTGSPAPSRGWGSSR